MRRAWIDTVEIDASGELVHVSYLLRATTPPGLEGFYADAGARSLMSDASVADHAAVCDGRVLEQGHSGSWRIGELGEDPTTGLLEQLAQAAELFQAEITARNPWSMHGSFLDETGWTTQGVAT